MKTSKIEYLLGNVLKRSGFELLAFLALSFALPQPLLAKPDKQDNGADTFRDDYCFTYGDYTYCYDSFGVTYSVETPSGNATFFGTGSSSYSQFDLSGTLVYEYSIRYSIEGLTMDDILRQLGQAFTTSTDVGDGVICTTKYQLRYIDSELLFERNDTVCQ